MRRRIKPTMVSTIDPRNAGRNPCTANPGTKIDASFSRNAFQISQNRPSVSNVSGIVRILSGHPTRVFTMAITTVAIKAVP